jgi:hypothetical protein
MALVFSAHGIIENASPQARFEHRNLVDTEDFLRYLAKRERPFVPLAQAIAGEGDALTVDDATEQSAAMCEAAVQNGHAASLFVNPHHVLNGEPHFWSRVNTALDHTRSASVNFQNREWPLNTFKEKSALRVAWRSAISACSCIEEVDRISLELAASLNVQQPPSVATISLKRLQQLAEAGVAVLNHGWSHIDFHACTEIEIADSVRRTEVWLRNYGLGGNHFAVPFGEFQPCERLLNETGQIWLLDNSNLSPGPIKSGVINRKTL